MLTGFLEEYTAQFVKGIASGKAATTILGVASAGFAEVELPIAAIGALISEGFSYFQNSAVKDDYKPGDVCLFFSGYQPVTPEEEAMMAMEMVDESFEPLANVPKYDVCLIVERLEGEKGYVVYDLAKKMNHTVLAKDLRPEQGNTISKFPVIQQIKEKFTSYVKPFLSTSETWKQGQYVYVTSREGNPDMEGTIASTTTNSMWIKLRTGELIELKKEDWHKLLTSDEIEGKRNITEHGRSNFRVQQLCYYHQFSQMWRPCIIIQLKPVCLIRTFNSREPIEVEVTKLLRMSSTQKTKLFHTHEYSKFIAMAMQNGFNPDIPLVTDPEMLAVSMEDDRTGAPGETTWEEDMEIIPASIETRQYGTIAPTPGLVTLQKEKDVGAYGPTARGRTAVETPYSKALREEGVYKITPRTGVPTPRSPVATPLVRAPEKESSTGVMLAVGAAVVVLGGILVFNK